jgi:2-methylisocitrate lyase-like PEP mutase family enzyme
MVCAPGVYDHVSLKVADSLGAEVLYMTGFGTVASYLGLPDAGLASYTDMVNRVASFCERTETPIVCDGDTGYGGLLNVAHTVRGYEVAGAAAIQLEDQEFPKKCGHTPNRRVIPTDEMVRKVAVAAEARRSSDFLIVARTDARTEHGIDEAIRRGHRYVDAGADVMFVESPETVEELAAIGQAFDVPALVNVVPGGRTPVLPAADYEQMGFAIAIYPVSGLLHAAGALREVYSEVLGQPSIATGPLEFADFARLIGFEAIWEFERTHAD